MTAADVACGLLGLVAVASALLVVTSRNVVHAGLWLVVTLGAVAGMYLVLAAAFLAWVQVLIYVGAVVVLLLFAAMMTAAPTGESRDLDGPLRPLACVVGVAVAGLMVTVEWVAFGAALVDLEAAVAGGAVGDVGNSIFRSWVLPFEVASVLLLAALVGAIVLSRPEVGDSAAGRQHRAGRATESGGAAR